MKKTELMDSFDFRNVCTNAFGIKYPRFNIYDDMVVLQTTSEDVIAILDTEANIVGVHRKGVNSILTDKEIANMYSYFYSNPDKENGISLPYPFENYSVKQLQQLANKISFHSTNRGRSFEVMVNEQEIIKTQGDKQADLLGCITFLDNIIYDYQVQDYRLKLLGLQHENFYQYLHRVVCRVEECIDEFIAKGRKPSPVNILEYIGNINILDEHCIYMLIDVLLRKRGYKPAGQDRIEKLAKKEDGSLTAQADELLCLLDVPEEVIQDRVDERNEDRVTIKQAIKEAKKYQKGVVKALELK